MQIFNIEKQLETRFTTKTQNNKVLILQFKKIVLLSNCPIN